MISIDDVPSLSYDVAICGSRPIEEVAGPGCYAVGVLLGILINQSIS